MAKRNMTVTSETLGPDITEDFLDEPPVEVQPLPQDATKKRNESPETKAIRARRELRQNDERQKKAKARWEATEKACNERRAEIEAGLDAETKKILAGLP